MRGLRSGIARKCWNIDSIGLFNIARYTASMPLLPSALPPKGEARGYIANDFLNLIALLDGMSLPFMKEGQGATFLRGGK